MALYRNIKRRPFIPPSKDHIWVITKKGAYPRLKRGTLKPAKLNTAFQKGADFMKLTSPAAKRIIDKLKPHLNGLTTGHLNANISGAFMKELGKSGNLSLTALKDFDFQKDYPFNKLFQEQVQIKQTPHDLSVKIPLNSDTIKRFNKLVTDYYFELILLSGNAAKDNGLRIESEDSPLYAIGKDHKTSCTFSVALPNKEWLAILKINSFEGNELAAHPKHYGLKVIATSKPISSPKKKK